jgi:hypothetical protein
LHSEEEASLGETYCLNGNDPSDWKIKSYNTVTTVCVSNTFIRLIIGTGTKVLKSARRKDKENITQMTSVYIAHELVAIAVFGESGNDFSGLLQEKLNYIQENDLG